MVDQNGTNRRIGEEIKKKKNHTANWISRNTLKKGRACINTLHNAICLAVAYNVAFCYNYNASTPGFGRCDHLLPSDMNHCVCVSRFLKR